MSAGGLLPHEVSARRRSHVGPCRRCMDRLWPDREAMAALPEADGIVWGKLVDKDALGPRCGDCIAEQVGEYAARDGWNHPDKRAWAIHWVEKGASAGSQEPAPAGVVPLLRWIRGMCSDEEPHELIDAKVAEAIGLLSSGDGTEER